MLYTERKINDVISINQPVRLSILDIKKDRVKLCLESITTKVQKTININKVRAESSQG